MKEVTRTKEYTEHRGKIHFANGDTEEVTFDGMKTDDNGVTLKDYMETRNGDLKQRAVRFIPHDNLNEVVTEERVTKEKQYTEEVKNRANRECQYCGERFYSVEKQVRHEETCMYRPRMYRPRRNTLGGRID